MSLENLVGISLAEIEPDPGTIVRLFEAARRNIDDARVASISLENRFDAAYKAVMQLANAALQANGFRTLTSVPGHHTTMLQSLTITIDLPKQTVIVLDALRKQRNVVDYSGDLVPESAVRTCISQAEGLLNEVETWLSQHIPGIFD